MIVLDESELILSPIISSRETFLFGNAFYSQRLVNLCFCFCLAVAKKAEKVTTQKCRRGNYIIEQIEVVLDVVVQVWQVGAHFEALDNLESFLPLVLPCIFFYVSNEAS